MSLLRTSSDPSDSASAERGPGRGAATPDPRFVLRLTGEQDLDPEVVRYAVDRARSAFGSARDLETVEVRLSAPEGGDARCRLRVVFTSGGEITVGHRSSELVHAIDTAVETAAHVVAARRRSC